MMLANNIKQKAQNVRLMIFDVDGVLTDGTLVYGSTGEEVKHFNVKDGVGLKLLQAYGIEVAIISAKSSKPLLKRIKDLGIVHAYTGCKDKLLALSELMVKLEVSFDEVGYCGDDVIDLKVMQKVGLSFAPSDAYEMVKNYSDFVTQSLGGKGVAREVADILLASRMSLDEAYIKAMLPEFEVLKDR